MAPARLALCVALILLATPLTAAAADVRQGGTITVPADVTLEDDLYAFGDTISILGTVHGDVVATGVNNVNVDGTVTGDVITAANSVTIRGLVGTTRRGSPRRRGPRACSSMRSAGESVFSCSACSSCSCSPASLDGPVKPSCGRRCAASWSASAC